MVTKILVTGASGFIGSHCVIDLLNHGYAVRGTVRNLDRAKKLRELFRSHTDQIDRLEFVEGSLTEKSDWPPAVLGCDGVFHVASPVPTIQPRNAQEVIGPAKNGTENVLNAVASVNIKRVVLTSSVAAIVGSKCVTDYTFSAQDWSDADDPALTPYSASKTIAEKTAWALAEKHGLELTVVNPVMVLGPALESDYGSSLELLYKLMRREIPLLPKIGAEIVDVRDVASLHRLAFENPAAVGQRLIAANGFLWFREVAKVLIEEFPTYARTIPTAEMPNWLTKVASLFIRELGSIMTDIGCIKRMDISPALALGWQPRTPRQAIVAGANSLVELGLV